MCCNKNKICSNHVHPLQLYTVTMSHHPADCSSSHVPWALAAAVMPSTLPSAQRTLLLKSGWRICQASHTGQVCYQPPGCQLLVGFMQVHGHQHSTHTKAVCSVEEIHQACMQISSRHAHAVLPQTSGNSLSSATLVQGCMQSFVNPPGKACCGLMLTVVWANEHLHWLQSPSDPPSPPHLQHHKRMNTDQTAHQTALC